MRKSTKKLVLTAAMIVLLVLSVVLFLKGYLDGNGMLMLFGVIAFPFSLIKLYGMYRDNIRDALPWIALAYTVILPFNQSALNKKGEETYLVLMILWFVALVYSVKALIKVIPDMLFKIAAFLYGYTIGINRMKTSEIFTSLVQEVKRSKPDAIVIYGKHQSIKGMAGNYDDKKGYRFNHVCLVDTISENDLSMQSIIEHKIYYTADFGNYQRGKDFCFTENGYRTLSTIGAYSLYKALCSELPEYGIHQGLEKVRHGTTTKPTGETHTDIHVSGDRNDQKYTVKQYEETTTTSYSYKCWYAFYLVKSTVSIADTDGDYAREKEKESEEAEYQRKKSLKKW